MINSCLNLAVDELSLGCSQSRVGHTMPVTQGLKYSLPGLLLMVLLAVPVIAEDMLKVGWEHYPPQQWQD